MGAKVRRKKEEFQENIFWVTISDLFIGMFMIFATLFFAFCANTGQGSVDIVQATEAAVQQMVEKAKQQDINAVEKAELEEMTPEERPVKNTIDVEIDPFSGMAKISDLELFKLNSAELTPKGKEFLRKFLPIYLDEVLSSELKQYVSYIIIQGHTDSHLFRGSHTPQEQYMLNMNLSMNRAYNVAVYAFDLSKNKPYYKDLTHIIRVEGASFSKPILYQGKEDYNRSRRVELRLVLKEQKFDILQQLLKHSKTTPRGTSEYEKL